MARFGALALLPATVVARRLRGVAARALFAGNAAHSFLDLAAPGTAAFGLLLGAAGHAVGWPIARGGSQRFADALVAYFKSLGGEVVTDAPVSRIEELGGARVVMLDIGPLPVRPPRRRAAADAVPPRARALSLRGRGLQGGLGAGRPGSVGGAGLRPRRHGSSGRAPGGGRGLGGRPRAGPGARAPLRALRPADAVRQHAGASGAAHGLGLLSRPQRVHPRPDRSNRGPGRALRAGVPGPDSGAQARSPRRSSSSGTPISSAATSTAAGWICCRLSAAPFSDRLRTAPRSTACISVRLRPPRAAGCTAWVVTMPPGWPSGSCANLPVSRTIRPAETGPSDRS